MEQLTPMALINSLPILNGTTAASSGVADNPWGDAAPLQRDLEHAVRGEVRFDAGHRAMYSTDASNYRQIPIGLVIPRDTGDVEAALDICRRHDVPVLARGGGTSLAGQCCNTAVVFDFSRYMNEVLEIDHNKQLARVQPGTILDHLRRQAEAYSLTFGPDPSTHNHCTLGGMIGNNSCGVHSQTAGKTIDNVEELEVITYDGLRLRVGAASDSDLKQIIAGGGPRGEIYAKLKALRDRFADHLRREYPRLPRRISGYSLDQLLPEKGFHVARALVGTEGTCVTVLEATVRLVHYFPHRAILIIGYHDVYAAGDDVPVVIEQHPIGLEAFDDRLVDDIRKKRLNPKSLDVLPEGGGWLLAEFGGDTPDEANGRARQAQTALEGGQAARSFRRLKVAEREQQQSVWEVREAGLGVTAFVPGEPNTWEGWEDSAVPPEKLGDYLRALRELMQRYDYRGAYYGHFGQGCVHTRINFTLRTQEGIDRYRRFMSDAAELVVNFGGSLSGEHGDGQSRGELLPIMYGPELMEAMRQFRAIWDPRKRMNPGKVIDPNPLDANLRLGTDYHPAKVETHFHYPHDKDNFAHAALRCVGVGKCRRTDGGVMCPSYMVTREEKHSTRGRARLLFEMLQGETIVDGWDSEEVKESLDLCLACKGCKGDCPVNVDMATYKAEFLSHYHEHHCRPRSAWSMGLIYWWARLASLAPDVVNLAGRAPGLSRLVKWIGGIAPQRELPRFARRTFVDWFRRREIRNPNGEEVLLWPDTFTNHFHPQIAAAAVEVLESAGFRVTIPNVSLCCGRPLYDYGMLGTARRMLQNILVALEPQISAGTPLVGLEPSCITVFRDELRSLFPDDQRAKRLADQSFLFSEFVEKRNESFEFRQLPLKAIVHGHCHHHSVLGMNDETKLLSRLVADYEVLDSGCCGMAGSFGFETEKYDVSAACGERVLLPRVRAAEPESVIVADGFSCQEQIKQLTDREALHMAQIMHMSLQQDAVQNLPIRTPEQAYRRLAWRKPSMPASQFVLLAAGAVVVAGAGWWIASRKR